jgi:hypothetical protein
MRQAYIARYPTPDEEVILARDHYWSPRLSAQFDDLLRSTDDCLQAWYADDHQTNLLCHRSKVQR